MVRAAHEEGVAVGLGLGGHAGAHGAARAALVVDDHRLAELRGQLRGQRTGERIRAAACGERNDQRDGALGPLRGGNAAETQGCHGKYGRGGGAIFHFVSSCCIGGTAPDFWRLVS
ncbi:hypothetical protein D3C72_1823830 [compost metagenome]